MLLSYSAMDRIVEERLANDPGFRKEFKKNNRPLLSHGRAMSEDALLAKLHKLGLVANRQELLRAFPLYISAQEMSEDLINEATSAIPDSQVDWVWIALTCLWERLRPEIPNTEMVNDKMQAGYTAKQENDLSKACRIWLETWNAILSIMQRCKIESLDEFDDCFGGTQSVFNWIQDLEMELRNAGINEPHFNQERFALCKTVVDRFADNRIPVDSFKIALAEFIFESGDRNTGDELYRRWLNETPDWGWGWIGWSDCHWLFATADHKNPEIAERIIREGLAIPGVEDRVHLLERLETLYEETGRANEAEALREEIKQLPNRWQETATNQRTIETPVGSGSGLDDQQLLLESLQSPMRPLGLSATKMRAHSAGTAPLAAESISPVESPQASDRFSNPPDASFPQTTKAGRNSPCPCGSGKKFKKCCGARCH